MRHQRQVSLAGIGEVGQRRLARALVSVPGSGFEAEMAVRYLAGAGVGRLRVSTSPLQAAASAVDPTLEVGVEPSLRAAPATCPFEWRDPAAAELANGSYLALHVVRAIVEDRR
jgi:hypothetical protein